MIRSRIPPDSEAIIEKMRASGQLDVVAGRVTDLNETGIGMEVNYVPRGSTSCRIITTSLVINCTGPESDYRKVNDILVSNLLRRGLIRPGPVHVGIDALPNGSIKDINGKPSKKLHTLGSTMKGVLWEVLAIPEIRVQAEQLAAKLLNESREA